MSRPPVCHFYQAGNCWNGDACSFSHPTVKCHTFASTGWCPYGYNCHFWHQPTTRNVVSNPPRKVCQFFLNNQCKYGQKCSFSHDITDEYSSARTLDEYRAEKKISHSSFNSQPSFTRPSSNSIRHGRDSSQHSEVQSLFSRFSPSAQPITNYRVPLPRPDKAANQVCLDNFTQDRILQLQQREVERLVKGVAAERIREITTCGYGKAFHLQFSSTDPDWAYDVREIVLNVQFSPLYPVDPLNVSVLPMDYLPAILVEHLNQSITSWIACRHKQLQLSNIAELTLQPFLRWLDRNLEHLFTDGLRKYKAQLYGDNKENSSSNKMDGSTVSTSSESLETQRTASCSSSKYESHNDPSNIQNELSGFDKALNLNAGSSSSSSGSEDDDGEDQDTCRVEDDQSVAPPSHTIQASQSIYLDDLKLNGKAGTIIQRRLPASLHCVRCRQEFSWIFNLHGDPFVANCERNKLLRSLPPHSVSCARCKHLMKLIFHASMAHAFDACIGTLHLDGCITDDITHKTTEVIILCTGCNNGVKLTDVQPGRPANKYCHTCHALVGVEFSNFRIQAVKGADIPVFTKSHTGKLSTDVPTISRKQRRLLNTSQNPLIQDGSPLPAYGTCKHYKKSYRWLRFPCCGRLDPCDTCHDEAVTDGHEMELATRMVCGFCSKEQAFSNVKPCVRCGKNLTASRSSHWEGGKGCRNKTTMSRKDTKKYSQMNKTVSKNKTK